MFVSVTYPFRFYDFQEGCADLTRVDLPVVDQIYQFCRNGDAEFELFARAEVVDCGNWGGFFP